MNLSITIKLMAGFIFFFLVGLWCLLRSLIKDGSIETELHYLFFLKDK